MRRKRLNITRQVGRLYFRRETRRLHDGSPDGETLWIYNSLRKPRKVSFVSVFEWHDGKREVSLYLGTFRIMGPVAAAKAIRRYLLEQ
jgi:hypothetical protein